MCVLGTLYFTFVGRKFIPDTTKIIVAQRISTTKRADKIVILDKGRIVDVGTHEELSQRPGYYREVFLLQNGMDQEKEVV